MLLRYGVSGFWTQGAPPPPTTDFEKFEKTCFSVIRQYGGEVLEINDVHKIGAGNYHEAYFKQLYDPDQAIVLRLNAHYPFLAIRTVPLDKSRKIILSLLSEWQKVNQIIKQEEIIFRFRLLYQFLEPFELKESLSFETTSKGKKPQLINEHEMSQTEVEMIYRWQRTSSAPLTVGDVIFNWWD
jgi:hypothetical protein